MERLVPIAKIVSTKHIIKGIVYKPNEVDTQGDWMTAEEIESMSYRFMKASTTNSIDVKHNFEKVDAYVCESYIAQALDPDSFPEGSWVVAIKVDDQDVWEGIENGDYEGISMAGVGIRDEDSQPPVS